ncbi:MAG: DUF2804 domain-containing protein [Acutalibacteraceae bacterium]|nr:DUF2804 domain-containing protein [Acutalibacteraceae bacterium]
MFEFTQHEITSEQPLLDSKGNITEPGFAKKLLWKYDRNAIKANKLRIKEWDYYYIGTQDYGLCLTVSDVGYVSSLSVSLLKFGDKPFQMNDSELGILPLGKVNMPSTSVSGDVSTKAGTLEMTFNNDGVKRHLFGKYDNFCNSGKTLTFDVVLSDYPEESMVIATPFDKDAHFYYNQKINCMKAEGFVKFDDIDWQFNEENKALGTLDWGRGVWTYDNTWYWGSGQMVLDDGNVFGFNIGYGFGNTSAASENMLFYNGKAHKLDQVKFNIPMKNGDFDYMSPWTFTSNDGRFEMSFKPVIDRVAPIDLKVICMIPHQVFGLISGTATLDDGTVVEIKDKMVFAERVHNKW